MTGLMTEGLSNPALPHSKISTSPTVADGLIWLVTLIGMLESRARAKTPPPSEQWESLMGNYKPSLIETWCDSDIETTALASQALVLAKPDSPLIVPALRWLLGQRQGAMWQSTKDTSQVVIALADYLSRSRELEPDETVTVRVNGAVLKTVRFTAADIGRPDEIVTMDGLKEDAHVSIEREGRGVVYFTTRLTAYSQAGLDRSESNGFTIERQYSVQDDKGNWQPITTPIANGQPVRVELRVKTDRAREYVLIEDPLPSGFEAREADDEMAWKGDAANGRRLPVTRRETRDDRVALFCSYLSGGPGNANLYVARYILRPESTGTRTALPTHVQLMYRPDVYGRTAQNQMEVK